MEIHARLIPNIVQSFSKDFYVSLEGMTDALEHKTMFNVVHHETGIKVDFWILDRTKEFDVLCFQRRQKQNYFGTEISMTSPEDLVLMKLFWMKESPSDRHINDIKGIIAVQHNLEKDYMRHWAERLSLLQSLNSFLN
ncbi:MAG: hypothetical protein HYY49_01620 [Ignavibacteriales bacterium]|nr:hypothetical protein [Ignavibacteriales bacterium]